MKSITQSNFSFKKKYFWFFVPTFLVVLYRLSIFTYDALQPGFHETQNGVLKIDLDERYAQSIMWYFETPWMLLFLAFTFQLFFDYRKKIKNYFSNTYKLELNWILSFLILFALSFVYGTVQDIISELYTELHYVQRWWLNLFMALITLYVGIRGYFTDTTKLNKLDFSFSPNANAIPDTDNTINNNPVNVSDINTVRSLMEDDKAYLNPELNLQDLAKMAQMTRAQLSGVINSGFHQNFNDFVNSYRVNAFKEMLKNNKQEQLSLVGIAHECGFNSKATFNRVFKKITNYSPSEYLKSQLN
ncbi:helix-turn-helix domain-containing protein [Winogradskyella aurantiaca]|uniref:helix-turn-helix domain-containing protein n=1 Tax=Winogradskyella aurantiaca TaxID=2219558 RepID=UPI001E4D9BB2|nr:helix-turn-helix domain-containing protein [Winogradskyella aurantiaca]